MKAAFSKIVVPTDFSDHANQALAYAEALASELGASLHLVHVIDMPTLPTIWSPEVYVPDLPGIQAAAFTDAQRRMEIHSAALRGHGIAVKTDVILGHVARAVTEYASDVGADLVVMSTHGRTGLAHLAMGSVAEHVVRLAPCPVLTIRTAGKHGAHRAA